MSSVMDVVSRLPPGVPDDLIIEILLWLPAKPLLRFLSVCREWHKIIKNPGFERDHFHRGREFTSCLAYWYGGKLDFEIHEELGGDKIALERYDVPGLNDILSMHGPCYGIICVEHTDNTLALWNPTTKRSRLLPTCPLVTSNSTEIGFGLDPVTDDLKIVLFDSELDQRQCAIYNSRNGAWNLLESNTIFYPDSYIMYNYGGCAVLNGVCYWTKFDGRAKKVSLLAFDMSSDLFQDTEVPEILQHRLETSNCTLDIIDERLALLSYDLLYHTNYVSNNIFIWQMKEHGCWTKHLAVKLDVPFAYGYSLRIWKRNQIFAWTKYMEEIFIYDLNSGNSRVIEFGRMKGTCKLFKFPRQYKESLISV